MRSPAKHSAKPKFVFLLLGALAIFMVTAPYTAEARGGRGGGVSSGGFSRSSPASGGSLSAPAVASRRQGSDGSVGAGQPRTARNAGDVGAPRGARSAGDVGQPRSAQSASGVGSTQGATGARAVVGNANPVTAQEMANYREQFQQQNKDKGVDWDARRPVDPEYGVPAPGAGDRNPDADKKVPVSPAVAAGAVAGAAVARNRADDYLDYADTAYEPSYLSEDDCSIKAVTVVNDVNYYRCSNAWYKRGYQGGNVVYIPTDPPPGQ